MPARGGRPSVAVSDAQDERHDRDADAQDGRPSVAVSDAQDEQYDRATARYKRALLAPIGAATVLEIGIGTFSHAELYPPAVRSVLGVEPDTGRHAAALAAARACGVALQMLGGTVRPVPRAARAACASFE